VGSEYISEDHEILEKYSRDYSFVQPRKPSYVTYPGNVEEVQGIVKYANHQSIPITPRSSGISFYGAGIPSQAGIILDLSRMNQILEVDGNDRKVRIEPGVTWAQVQSELKKQGMTVCNPLLPHPLKSVLTSSMEREPILIPKSEYNETFQTGEVVLANGDMFYLGTAVGKAHVGRNSPEHFIPSARLFLGAQGTLGIITWAILKVEWLPTVDKLFFIPFNRIEDLPRSIYQIQRRMIGNECLVLDKFNLAAILAEKWPNDFEAMRDTLPPWTLILCLSAGSRYPEEKIEYEEEALMEVAAELKFDILRTLSGISGLERKVMSLLREPWYKDPYWKFLYKGSCHDIFFYTTMNRIPEFNDAIHRVAIKYGYPTEDIGFYLQPVERGRISYCQFSFHGDPNDEREMEMVQHLYDEASEQAINMGGIFTTPYGVWADMIYSRTATYTAVMKLVKHSFDPNNIMNPGKLCF
jgi:FAD/FMN-containing dehydrogenase